MTDCRYKFYCHRLECTSRGLKVPWIAQKVFSIYRRKSSLGAAVIYSRHQENDDIEKIGCCKMSTSYGRCPLWNVNLIPWLASSGNAFFTFKCPLIYRFVVYRIDFCQIITLISSARLRKSLYFVRQQPLSFSHGYQILVFKSSCGILFNKGLWMEFEWILTANWKLLKKNFMSAGNVQLKINLHWVG